MGTAEKEKILKDVQNLVQGLLEESNNENGEGSGDQGLEDLLNSDPSDGLDLRSAILFVFGLIVAAAWTKPVANEDGLPKDEVLPSSAKANVFLDFGDLKCDDENVKKIVDENVVKLENGVSASAKASVKFAPKTFKFDWKKMFEKMFAKLEEDQKQDADIKVSELSCENSEENRDNESAKKGPIRFSFRVCSTASAKA